MTISFQKRYSTLKSNETMKYNISYDVFTRLYHTTLLGGEFDNCHGQGPTKESAVASLKIRVYQLRGKQSKN